MWWVGFGMVVVLGLGMEGIYIVVGIFGWSLTDWLETNDSLDNEWVGTLLV